MFNPQTKWSSSSLVDLKKSMDHKNEKFPFFPIPVKGETVYSVFCRIFQRSGLSRTYILESLTGQKSIAPILNAVSGCIPEIVKSVPIGHPWCYGDYIATHQTVLPYYLYFDSNEIRELWITRLANETFSHPLAMALGLSKYKTINNRKLIRYCPLCLEEQIQSLGFSFFKREHQLPGTVVCPKHRVFLAYGCKNCGPYPIPKKSLCMPGRCLCSSNEPLIIETSNLPGNFKRLHWFAMQNSTMVESSGSVCGNIREILRNILIQRGYSRGKLLDYRIISERIKEQFGADFCEWLGYPIIYNTRPPAWLRRLFGNETWEQKRTAVIPFLLVIGALYNSILDFEVACKNDIANIKESIHNDNIILTCQNDKNNLVEAIVDHIKNGTYSLRGLSKKLGVKYSIVANTLKENKIRLPLTENVQKRIGRNINQIRNELKKGTPKSEIQSKYQITEWALLLIELDQPDLHEIHKNAVKENRKERHRNIIRELLKKNPNASRSYVISNLIGTYEHLMKYDKDWFYSKIKKKRIMNQEHRRNERYDRDEMDEKKATELQLFLNKINATNKKPVWITTSFCLNGIHFYHYRGQEARFPKTKSILVANVESYADFVARKISWALKNYERNECVSLNILRRRVGVPVNVLKNHQSHIVQEVQKYGLQNHPKSFFHLNRQDSV